MAGQEQSQQSTGSLETTHAEGMSGVGIPMTPCCLRLGHTPTELPTQTPSLQPKSPGHLEPQPTLQKRGQPPGGRLAAGVMELAFLFGGPVSESPSKSGESSQCQIGPTNKPQSLWYD